ncbi:hypothetical protein FACS189419_09190 [Planctomycetales bacterium]|nr:hypothetical protein FACS189419_09190 [Planctomycetales bacterium]
MSILQTYIGSAFSSYPVRWAESPGLTRTENAPAGKPVGRTADSDSGKPQSASGDVLDISLEGKISLEDKKVGESEKTGSDIELTSEKPDKSSETAKPTEKKLGSNEELTAEEQEQVEKLKARDREVRQHEAAHVATAGQYATSGPSYTFQTGPDGGKYAVGGEVGVDTSVVSGDPQATIQKMQTVAAAALAPAEPSSQDRKVAAEARQKIAEARMELAQQNSAEQTDKNTAGEKTEGQSGDEAVKTEPSTAPEDTANKTPFNRAVASGTEDKTESKDADAVSRFAASASAAYKNHSAAAFQGARSSLSSTAFVAFA